MTLALQVIIIHAPPVQTLFRTVPLGVNEWVLVLVVAFVATFWIEAAKWTRVMMAGRTA